MLDRAFAGARSVLWIVFPDLCAASLVGHCTGFTRAACEAVTRQGVGRVVTVSRLGRGIAEDTGVVAGACAVDDLLEATGVAHRDLRVPAFIDDLLGQADLIRTQGKFVGSQSADGRGPACATRDITLANTMKGCYGLDHVPSEREISDIAAAWAPCGSLGVNLIFAAAELDG